MQVALRRETCSSDVVVPDLAIAKASQSQLEGALASLRVFRSPFTVEAANAVLGFDANLFESLLAAGGIEYCDDARQLFCLTRALRLGEVSDDHRRSHARYFAALPHPAQLTEDQRVVLRQQEEDLVLAWRTSMQGRGLFWTQAATRIALVLDLLLVERAAGNVHIGLLEETAERCARMGTEGSDTCDLLCAIVRVLLFRGRYASAEQVLRRAYRYVPTDCLRQARVAVLLCFCLRALGKKEAALDAGHLARDIAETCDNQVLVAQAKQMIAIVDLTLGQPVDAERSHAEALVDARNTGCRRTIGIALTNLAQAHQFAGNVAKAEACYAEARALFGSIGSHYFVARLRALYATLAASEAYPNAAILAEEALVATRAQEDCEGELEALYALCILRSVSPEARAQNLARFAEAVTNSEAAHWPLRLALATASVKQLSERAFVRMTHDCAQLWRGEQLIDLRRRAPLRRIVHALVSAHPAGQALGVQDLLEAAWPGERMRAESGNARVYMAIRRLRTLGLADLIITCEGGYALRSDLDIQPA
jgi:tetratricopeptide (TPR) repeat protein